MKLLENSIIIVGDAITALLNCLESHIELPSDDYQPPWHANVTTRYRTRIGEDQSLGLMTPSIVEFKESLPTTRQTILLHFNHFWMLLHFFNLPPERLMLLLYQSCHILIDSLALITGCTVLVENLYIA